MAQLLRSNQQVLAAIGIWLLLASCGKADRSPVKPPSTDAGASGAGTAASGNGGTPSQSGGAGRAPGGTDGGGETAEGGASVGGAPAACVEGAACQCGDLTGILHCDESAEGECSCPPAEVCERTPRSCFEPCGGIPFGVWVLEQTCFNASSEGLGCEGAFIDAVATGERLRLQIFENQPLAAKGEEGVDVTAQVPLQCLGIESVERCSDVDFYAAPLLYTLSRALDCQANECGHCECSAQLTVSGGNGFPGLGEAWQPGSATLSFGGMKVPYCVDGDTLWAGGVGPHGTPKVAYRFSRKSCVGTPLPCSERQEGECGSHCIPGRCVADAGGDASICAELAADLNECELTNGCRWDPAGCWGVASELCEFSNCDETPGCSWGPPQARCGGQIASCYERGVPNCSDTPGCSARTCYVERADESAECADLTTSAACTKAPGCTWSAASCSGVTRCSVQTDLDVCSALGCYTSEVPICGGQPTEVCSDFGVDDCQNEPFCRLEW